MEKTSNRQPVADDPSSARVICAIANAKEDKGLDVLIEAFAIVRNAFPTARLWIVGDGKLRGHLQALARHLGVADEVVFWGFRSDVPAILSLATVGVNSSRTEGLCNAIMEYMAAGIPTVATTVGGNPELVLDGETGVLTPLNDAQALAHALIGLLADSELAARYGKAARLRLEHNFSMSQMIHQTEAVYEELFDMH